MTPPDRASYTGIENLEAMAEAENYNRYLMSLITDQLGLGDCVLDFGAGAGTFAVPLVRQGINLICVEPDPGLKAGLEQLGVRVVADASAIPDGSIDLLYTLNVLEHIEEDEAVVGMLARKLAPGGRILVYVPAFACLFTSMDRKVGHIRRYRKERMIQLLTESDLRVLDARYADSLGFAATLLYRAIGSDDGEINRRALKIYDRLVFPVSRAIDAVASSWVGKNLLALAIKA